MIAAISLIQNGPVPRYFSEEQVDQIFVQNGPCTSKCVLEFQRGLDRLGIHQFSQHLNQFISIFRHRQERLTVKSFIQLFPPQFSEEGSNKLQFEKIVYNKFIKYCGRLLFVSPQCEKITRFLCFVCFVYFYLLSHRITTITTPLKMSITLPNIAIANFNLFN